MSRREPVVLFRLHMLMRMFSSVGSLWNAITAKGKPGQCGWCTDEFGLTWQVSPIQMREHLENPDREKAAYANQALMKMSKIIIEDLYE